MSGSQCPSLRGEHPIEQLFRFGVAAQRIIDNGQLSARGRRGHRVVSGMRLAQGDRAFVTLRSIREAPQLLADMAEILEDGSQRGRGRVLRLSDSERLSHVAL